MNKLKEINGKYYQECQVVILFTEKPSKIIKCSNQLSYHPSGIDVGIKDYQHLYITSDEKIKSGELCLDDITGTIKKAENNLSFKDDYCLKIIATTDSSLDIAQPSKQFIKKYIEEYNKGNKIENVLVEQDHYIYNPETEKEYKSVDRIDIMDCEQHSKVKVDSHNCITIKPIKDSWTREEVKTLLLNLSKFKGDHHDYLEVNKWIEENL